MASAEHVSADLTNVQVALNVRVLFGQARSQCISLRPDLRQRGHGEGGGASLSYFLIVFVGDCLRSLDETSATLTRTERDSDLRVDSKRWATSSH